MLATLVFSIIYLILVQFIPQCMSYIIIPFCVVSMVFVINLVKVFITKQTSIRTGIFISLIVLVVLIIISALRNCISIRLHAIFLKAGSQVVSWRKSVLFFIPLFLICLIILVAMVSFEFVGFWSNGRKIFLPKEFIYMQTHGFQFSTGVAVLLVIQLIWGFSFIKESCISFPIK